ncbi:hypothetical protein AAVH_02326 [Aphelenchoides avenae]|nr:hypothetical protein AAVH_02326 [Aphelenchus avenae]
MKARTKNGSFQRVIRYKQRFAVDRIRTIIRWTESNGAHARDVLLEYEDRTWPVLVEADAEVRCLAQDVRQAIDACSIGESRLEWLLAVNKFQVQADQMVTKLIGDINEDLEHVLNLRERCATLYGLHLKQETVECVEEMQRLLKVRLLQM